jgi:tetratricopeptide (TPR) repeat protein
MYSGFSSRFAKGCFMIAALCLVFPVKGQTLGRNDALKSDADYYLMEKDFDKAQDIYLNILKSEPDNAAIKYRLGICYLNSADEKAKAITYLEDAAQKVSEKYNESSFKETNAPVDALFLLGSAYRINNQLDKAEDAYIKYKQYLNPNDAYDLEVVDQYLKSCNVARDLETKPVNLTVENIGNKINTPVANFNAVVSGDGKTMFYTATGKQGYDVYSSTLTSEGWTAPKLMTSVLATGKFMKTCDLSFDGTTLLLVLEDPMNSDIFISHLEKGKWSKAELLNKEIDSKSNETHASLSPDGKTLYFTSDRKGGLGDLDIYRSELNSKGEWGKPENMGPMINTRFNEETPFVSSDGSKLYFSSEGHESMGGYDVFKYDFNNPTAGVVNMGFPLNTTDNDLFYFPVDDGLSGYYSYKGNENYGGRDIYKITIQPAIEETPVAVEAAVPTVAEAPLVAETPVVTEPVITPADTTPVVADTLVEKRTEQPVPEPAAAPVEITTTQPDAVPEKVEEPVSIQKTEPVTAETEVVKPEITPKVSPSAQGGFNFYRVQLMALRKPVSFDFFAGVSNLTVTYNEDHWYRYSTWGTRDYSKVREDLQEMIGKGYRDAFIRGEKLGGAFTIQIMAVPGPVVDLSGFANLSQVMVTKGPDNFCRYTTGVYATKEEAVADLQRIKSMGYQKAFVTRLNFLSK